MATWTDFRYGQKSWRKAQHWVPGGYPAAPGLTRPCLVYFPGHGWEGRHPGFFYGDGGGPLQYGPGEPLFVDHIEPAEGTQDVVCISAWSASKNYGLLNNVGITDWDVGETNIPEGDLRDNGGAVYRCLVLHNASSATEPGVGADWEHRWALLEAHDISNNLWPSEPPRSPGFLWTGTRDVQVLVQYLKRNAHLFGIDRNKIVPMGSSAGGQQVGTAVWGRAAPHLAEAAPHLSAPSESEYSSSPQAVVLDITPNDWKWYPFEGLQKNLWGQDLASSWDDISDAVKSGLSPLGVLRVTQAHCPTYLSYGGNGRYTGAADDPPYASAEYHHARNGWEMLKELDTLGQTNLVFLEDSPTAGFYRRWTDPTTFADIATGGGAAKAQDIWDWLVALWGL